MQRRAQQNRETALLSSLDTLGVNAETLRATYPRIAEAPFDADRKRMSTLHRDPAGGLLLAVKGAPEVIAARLAAIETSRGPCDADDDQRAWIRHAAEQLSEAGLRTLALAYRTRFGSTSPISDRRGAKHRGLDRQRGEGGQLAVHGVQRARARCDFGPGRWPGELSHQFVHVRLGQREQFRVDLAHRHRRHLLEVLGQASCPIVRTWPYVPTR
ncbi:MAG: hypothetical protein ACM3ZF_11630 [Mycobacterium leprae]